jgi:hypothetical protein
MAINPARWKLKLGTVEGIPDAMRPTLWYILSAGKKRTFRAVESEHRNDSESEKYSADIDIALERRSFPHGEESIKAGARNVLLSVARDETLGVGYCPGMCDVAIEMVRLLTEKSAQDVMMTVLMPQIRGLYVGELGRIYISLLRQLLEEREPALFAHLTITRPSQGDDALSLVFLPMYKSLFYRHLGKSKVWIRLMDLLICESNRILISTTLAILLMFKVHILESVSEPSVLILLSQKLLEDVDEDELLKQIFDIHRDAHWVDEELFKEFVLAEEQKLLPGESDAGNGQKPSPNKCTIS